MRGPGELRPPLEERRIAGNAAERSRALGTRRSRRPAQRGRWGWPPPARPLTARALGAVAVGCRELEISLPHYLRYVVPRAAERSRALGTRRSRRPAQRGRWGWPSPEPPLTARAAV